MDTFILPSEAKSAQQYIEALKAQSGSLSDKAVREGIDLLTEKRINEIRTSANIPVKGGRVYYVSENGNDENDGSSPEKAIKTLAGVNALALSEGDFVLFERGGVYRGNLVTVSGVTYTAYGEGEKPALYGWEKNSASPELWEETDEPNVWLYAEPIENDVGNIVFDDKTHTRKVVRSTETDGTHLDYRAGRIFNDYHDLTEDLTFFHDSFAYDSTGRLYLRCEAGNPGKVFDDIEMAQKRHVVTNGANENVRIDNLVIAYGGAHGVGSGSAKGLCITNCEFKWIGGSLQMKIGGYGRTWPTPYGNAVEIYGEAIDYTVDNCYIHDVYDAGVTHQFGEGCAAQNSHMHPVHNDNVRYINNVFERCVYSVEIFYGGSDFEERSNDNTHIENNIMRMGGGFGHDQRPDAGVTALIRNGRIILNTHDYTVKNNIFDRSRSKIITAANDGGSLAQYFGNIYVQNRGGRFCNRLGADYIADEDLPAKLEATGTEHDGKFIFVDDLGYND